MAIGNFEESSPLVPNPDGTGNDVKLKGLPYFEQTEKFKGIRFPFIDDIESEYIHGHFDPYDADTEKRKNAGLARLLHLYGALVPKNKYDELKEYDEKQSDNIEDFIAFANPMIDESIFDEPLRILVAYNGKGYVTMPAYGDVISSKHKPKRLQHTPASKTTLKPVAKQMDDEMSGGGSSNDM